MTHITNIIQWNIRGIGNKKKEVIHLLNQYKAGIIAIQETMMPTNRLYKIPKYTLIAKEGILNHRNHGGVAMYIHEDIPQTVVHLNTELQAIAATVHLKSKLTICNIYNSRNHNLTVNSLKQLYDQLPQPCLILGDFNAYSPMWGCNNLDARGRNIETFIDQANLILLNNGAPTHPNNTNDTAIDLSLSSPIISQDFEWNTIPSLFDSDHFPIILTTHIHEADPTPMRLMRDADWNIYKHSTVWENIPQEFNNNEEMLEDLCRRIDSASDEAIPIITPTKFYPKPFWTRELTESRNQREIFYQRYRRNPTLQNQIRWKRSRAQHKNNVRLQKEQSWKTYISELNEDIPISEICKRVKKMKGISSNAIRILSNDDEPTQTYSTPEAISEILAQTFAKVSSDENYSPEFLEHKQQREQNIPDFGTTNATYNKPFTLDELNNALAKTKDSSPGEDGIHYKMLKNMPLDAKKHLLKMYNKFFKDSYFPQTWTKSIIIPILKPGKNPNSPKSYRPIALTSCLCKLLERMINERFMEYLIMHRILATTQSGGQKNRSTVDHLVRLEDSIRKAFASKEHYISVFFDLERAYDMTWRKGIIIDLYNTGLRGLLPKYVEKFLEKRAFKVKIGNTISNEHEQQNGVPQGAVLSVLLFALKINDIVKNFPYEERFTVSLFVDDLQIGFRHVDLNVIKNTIQIALDKLHTWTRRNGFKFSSSKTKVVHFTKETRMRELPELKLGQENLSYSTSAKFLGITYDSKLTWQPHLKNLKINCQKLLGIMKMLTSQKFGATQSCLMKIYRMYVRAKLDYGSIVYSSACTSELNKLDVVCNDALRIATGAFKSSPLESLYVLADEMRPQERREYLSMRYYLKIKAALRNPTNDCITYRNETYLRNNQQSPFIVRITDIKMKYNLPQFTIKNDFSYSFQECKIPKYALHNPIINKKIAEHPKETTSPALYKNLFLALVEEEYRTYNKIYTDGSKSSDGVGAAAVTTNSISVATLPKESSIYSAEVYALQMAVDFIERSNGNITHNRNVIFTDSKSTVDSLHNQNDHPVIRYIIHKLNILKNKDIVVEICWIPSHVGIEGNEKADIKAKQASKRRPQFIPIFYKDYYSALRSKFDIKRNNAWQNIHQSNKLKQIKPDLKLWPPLNLKRKEEVVINRIRLGHTNMTHGYLMDNTQQFGTTPICLFCNDATLTIAHIFKQCPRLEASRRHHFRPLTTWNLETMLGIHADNNKILSFLRSNQLFTLI